MSESRIQTALAAARQAPRRGLVAYTMAGDIAAGATVEDQARRCGDWARAGVDVLEIGVPFSDPMADGPTIQRAHARALARQTSVADVFALIKAIRAAGCQTPVVLMTYLNPIVQFGFDAAIEAMRASGVDGLLLVDGPSSEIPEVYDKLIEANIDPITLVAPNTEEARLRVLLPHARGFIYLLALKGVTGSRLDDFSAIASTARMIRQHSSLPIAVGFGIREPAQLAALPSEADAVVVGSALTELTETAAGGDSPAALELIRSFSAV